MRQYFKTPKKILINSFLPIFFGLIFVAAIIYAWTEPSQVPPGCTAGQPGCDAPLNVGPNYQTKIGPLVLNTGGAPTGLIVQNGNVVIGDSSSSMALSQPNGAWGDSTQLELSYDADAQGFLMITKNGNRAMQLDDGQLMVDNNRAIRARINDNQGVGLNPSTIAEIGVSKPLRAGDITWYGGYGFLGWDGTKWVSLQSGSTGVGTYKNTCPVGIPTCHCDAGDLPLGCSMSTPNTGCYAFYTPPGVGTIWWGIGGSCFCFAYGGALCGDCIIGCLDVTP